MRNEMFGAVLAASVVFSPLASQAAEDVSNTVSGVLCYVPQECNTAKDLEITINPEQDGGLRQVAKKSTLDINFSCSAEDSLRKSFHVNIDNKVPVLFHGPFLQGEGIPYQILAHDKDIMICSIPYSQIPVK